jgi:hypothetical protein
MVAVAVSVQHIIYVAVKPSPSPGAISKEPEAKYAEEETIVTPSMRLVALPYTNAVPDVAPTSWSPVVSNAIAPERVTVGAVPTGIAKVPVALKFVVVATEIVADADTVPSLMFHAPAEAIRASARVLIHVGVNVQVAVAQLAIIPMFVSVPVANVMAGPVAVPIPMMVPVTKGREFVTVIAPVVALTEIPVPAEVEETYPAEAIEIVGVPVAVVRDRG